MNKLIVLVDNENNVYLYEHPKKPKLLASRVDVCRVLDNRIAIIKNNSLYTLGRSTATGDLGTPHNNHPIFLKVDDNVYNVVLEKGCLRYEKNNFKTSYCGTNCTIKDGDNELVLPVVCVPQEYFTANENNFSTVPEWTDSMTQSCDYVVSTWISNETFFLQIFDNDLYFRSKGAYSNEDRGELVMNNIVGILC